MLGYITADTENLKVRDFRIYNGYYCGLCKSIGDNYPEILRTQLSYDLAFFACLLSSVTEEEEITRFEHCIAHPIQKRPVIECEAVDYAADLMIILAYEKYLDDVRDKKNSDAESSSASNSRRDSTELEGSAASVLSGKTEEKSDKENPDETEENSPEDARFLNQRNESMALGHKVASSGWIRTASIPALQHAYRKACINQRGRAERIHDDLSWLHAVERSKLGDIDLACECFSEVLKTCADGIRTASGNRRKRILLALCSALGKWIYLIDALEDLEEDLSSGNYNPFIYHFGGPEKIGPKEKKQILQEGSLLLYHYLEETAADYELLDIIRSRDLLDNILYLGIRKQTDRILVKLADDFGIPKSEVLKEKTEEK
ncbi:MAG: DUF5685 family protein [Eubacteriales bacterium]|nr:DUF5685 family protein [Eubacteriales bacterium]